MGKQPVTMGCGVSAVDASEEEPASEPTGQQKSPQKVKCIRIGDKVVAKYGGYRGKAGSENPWFAATISSVTSETEVAVAYADGDRCNDITADEVLYCNDRPDNWRDEDAPEGSQPVRWDAPYPPGPADPDVIVHTNGICSRCHAFCYDLKQQGIKHRMVMNDPSLKHPVVQGVQVILPIVQVNGLVISASDDTNLTYPFERVVDHAAGVSATDCLMWDVQKYIKDGCPPQ